MAYKGDSLQIVFHVHTSIYLGHFENLICRGWFFNQQRSLISFVCVLAMWVSRKQCEKKPLLQYKKLVVKLKKVSAFGNCRAGRLDLATFSNILEGVCIETPKVNCPKCFLSDVCVTYQRNHLLLPGILDTDFWVLDVVRCGKNTGCFQMAFEEMRC